MIKEIKIDKFPVVIFSDSHTNLENIKQLQQFYPDNLILSLGDITFLFTKSNNNLNSIDFFINSKIPTLLSNHEQFIYQSSEFPIKINYDDYGLNQQQLDYLRTLPIGFKLILPNNKEYLCFHHTAKDFWSSFGKDDLPLDKFKEHYPLNVNTVGVIHGHLHQNFIVDYSSLGIKRYSIGTLANGQDRHTNENKACYILLTENGIEYKKLE